MDDPDPSTTPGNDPIQSPVESSSDELAAGSDREEVERRRATWSALTPKRPYRRSRSFSGSESPDELAMDANDYWRSRDRARSLSQEMSVQGEGEEERGSDYDEEYRPLEDDRTEPDDAQSDRSLTPVPPPPPPRPEEINYKQKFLLKGHQRGVSAVRFSPDCSMIASGGMCVFQCTVL